MDTPSTDTVQLEGLLERLRSGDEAARGELLACTYERLGRLARRMLRDYPRVRGREQTDDVLQNAQIRLWQALLQVTPGSAREFYGLASLQLRRVLLDLARHYAGPAGSVVTQGVPDQAGGADSTPPALAEEGSTTHEPSRLACWAEFHLAVDALPAEEREVIDLLWYQELAQPEAAAVLGISLATLKRRWVAARRHLQQRLPGGLPGE
jgi:RNA polymerase sigma-70 factor (ECF subfamily)